MRSEEAAWREQLAKEKREREAKEAAWLEQSAKEKREREAKETAWREQSAKEEREREAKEAAWRAKMEREKKERDAEEAARQAAYAEERRQAERRLDRAIHRMIGDGDERFGRLMEALTEGDLPPLLQRAGFDVHDEGVVKRMGVSNRGIPVAEFDLTALGDGVTVAVEVKATLRPEDVRHFVGKMERFRGWFPDSARGALHGAVAYLSATDSAPKMAARRGLLLIRVVGSSASIMNPADFAPRHF